MSVFIIVKIILLLVALVAWLNYQSRRKDNQNALAALRRTQVVRELQDDEALALESLRVAHGLAWETGVRRLRGRFSRHGIIANGVETLHDTLGGVDVLLPYDAPLFLAEDNHADVVLTERQAIVVRLNDFSVVEGRSRSLHDGRTDGLPPGAPPLPAPPSLAAQPVTTLEERAETFEEAQLRRRPAFGWLPTGFWIIALSLLLTATVADLGDALPLVMLLAIAAALAGIVCQLRPPLRKIRPGRVRRVEGVLHRLEMPNPMNAALRLQRFFVGDSLQVQVPVHWQQCGRLPLQQSVQLDIAQDTGDVLSIGPHWSRVDEQRRFPPIRWGGTLLLLVIALLGAVTALLAGDGDDLRLAWHGLQGTQTRTDSRADSVLQDPPQPGDRVRLSGEGQCELALTRLADTGTEVVLPDCARMRWGATTVVLPALAVPDPLLSLYRGSFVDAQKDGYSTMLRMLMMQQISDPYQQALMAARGEQQIVTALGRMIDTVEAACAVGLRDCAGLQQSIVRALGASVEVDGQDTALDDWPKLAQHMRRLATEGEDGMYMTGSDLAALRGIAREHAGAAIATRLAALTPQLISLQRGGVVLETPDDLRDGAQHAPRDPVRSDTLLDHWQEAGAVVATPVPFSLQGLVLSTRQDAGGLRLRVEPGASDDRIQRAVASSLMLLLSLTLIVVQAVLLARGILRARARRRALDADLQSRPAPGQPA
ncbi:IgaA/UmoB family intracellular growth attenuator [Stenotrophomonas maltophilia]|uniref:IgaA/UmoB family intracellular growth attenuator n=1 Tax=Stenotrophomonas maltophilia TaxID=40324 RepID=UPI00131248D1|nr:IgaA/UmoB family intracellular growth attenuator [Stenotrophomonas maltophilia]